MGALTAISFIVPARNAAATLDACLAPLLKYSPACEIIVVDDGSSDETGTVARGLGVRLLSVEGPVGPGAARNAGAAIASGDVLVFVDADVVASPTAIEALIAPIVAACANHPPIAATFGSYDAHPAAPGTVSTYRNLLHHFTHQQAREQSRSFWAGFGAIRRDTFASVGGFDARRYPRPSIEDIEMGARLSRTGAAIRLVKEAHVTHLKRWTLLSMIRVDIRDRAWPWAELLLSGEAPTGDLNVSGQQRMAALAAIALILGSLSSVTGLLAIVIARAIAAADGGAGTSAVEAAGARAALAVGAVIALIGAISLTVVNRELYGFFARSRGWRFASAGFSLHVLYYLYSAATYAARALHLRVTTRRRAPREGAA